MLDGSITLASIMLQVMSREEDMTVWADLSLSSLT